MYTTKKKKRIFICFQILAYKWKTMRKYMIMIIVFLVVVRVFDTVAFEALLVKSVIGVLQ